MKTDMNAIEPPDTLDAAYGKDPSERQLAKLLEDAFLRLQDSLLGTLYYLVGNKDDAQDALQETFVKAWRHRHELPKIKNLKAWIFRIALNTGRDMRSTAWSVRRRQLAEEHAMLEAKAETPDEALSRKEQVEQIRDAIVTLRPEEQEVFLLRQNGDMTYDEIADAMGLPSGTVKTRMRLALAKLRKSLK
ncbi:MAG: RNA polymerase sigma factor [Pirellulales bacterium]|nr:RNA polymerase sigma factor [Pirellulales bacterium]